MWFRLFFVVLALVAAIAILDILSPGDDDGTYSNNPTQTLEGG